MCLTDINILIDNIINMKKYILIYEYKFYNLNIIINISNNILNRINVNNNNNL
jgi:hypothetical protein